jgi:hypothetical protein
MSAEAWDWTRPVVDHMDLHAADFKRSVRFYETVLAPLGIPKLYEREGEACFTHVNVVARTPPTTGLRPAITPRICSNRTGTTSKRSIATSAIPAMTVDTRRISSGRGSRS